MASITNFLEAKLLDHTLRATTYTQPATVYAAAFTTATDDAGGGTEVSGGAYARQAVTFGAAASRQVSNSAAVTYPTATANWGTITHMAFFDALTSGNMLAHGALDASKSIDNGSTLEYAIGDLTITIAAAGITDYLANELLDHVFRNAAYTSPATVYLGLYTTATTDASGGTEVSGGAYARTAATFGAVTGNQSQNSAAVTFPTATANWGTITHNAILDASTSGNMLYHGALTTSQVVNNTQTYEAAIGDLVASVT